MLWAGKKRVCFALASTSARHSPQRTSLQSCAFAAAAVTPSFYQKHLEPLNSYSVRILKQSNQSFYIQTRAERYKISI